MALMPSSNNFNYLKLDGAVSQPCVHCRGTLGGRRLDSVVIRTSTHPFAQDIVVGSFAQPCCAISLRVELHVILDGESEAVHRKNDLVLEELCLQSLQLGAAVHTPLWLGAGHVDPFASDS